jgi:hypothetical protein
MHRKLTPRLIGRSRTVVVLAAGMLTALSLAAGAIPASAADPQNGFKTKQPPMLAVGPDAPFGTEIKPILTVGDTIGGYRYEAIPDGISWMQSGKNEATVFVNHETSTVPFPYAGTPTPANSQNDFDNSQLSRLTIRNGGAVLDASLIIPSSANYQRFCSETLGTAAAGFSRPILFNNEEGIDWVKKTGTAFPATEGAADAREIGAVVASDVTVAGAPYTTVWGMGRFNHENNIAVPGYGKPVLLSGDDSFVTSKAQSQVYAYIANSADAVLGDQGTLYAFVPDNAGINDYYDFARSSTGSISGHFIAVPKMIATGRDASGNDITSADVVEDDGDPYPLPPNDGTWQRPPGSAPGNTGVVGIDGPQWVLEHWSDEHNVFQFIRIEDMAVDKRPGMSNVIYLADSGRGIAGSAAPQTDTTYPFPVAPFTSSNGRIWKMVLSPTDPTVVQSLSILIEGDDNPVKTVTEVHQPDNLETTVNGLYITEDPGSSQQFDATQQVNDPARATTARLWQYTFADASLHVVAKVDQSADEGPTDVDTSTTAGRWGEWESTGVVDVSGIFGPGKFLINVQAHTLWVEKQAATNWTNKREGGQLLLITIPGG